MKLHAARKISYCAKDILSRARYPTARHIPYYAQDIQLRQISNCAQDIQLRARYPTASMFTHRSYVHQQRVFTFRFLSKYSSAQFYLRMNRNFTQKFKMGEFKITVWYFFNLLRSILFGLDTIKVTVISKFY